MIDGCEIRPETLRYMVVLCTDFGLFRAENAWDGNGLCLLSKEGNMGYFSKINVEEHVTLRLKYCTQIIVELK